MVRAHTPELLSNPDRQAVQKFLRAARPIGCARWSAVATGTADVLLAATTETTIVGVAQADANDTGYVVDCIAEDSAVREQLVRSLFGGLPTDADAIWWGHDNAADVALAEQLHMHATSRRLLNMRRPLPLESSLALADNPPMRSFVVGTDEQAWLSVNNAAFSWHGEQGDWDLTTLQARMTEPWFDPAGFLLHEREGRLAGFCWTKVHEAGTGEIYVIAVHPDFSGHGLGRALTIAGLRHLSETGSTRAMLYVEADNAAAVRLYESLGFRTAHIDVAYHRTAVQIEMTGETR